ncbi:MAG: hypothetical protein CVV64_11230 [Candidatus Wallbacteria bacterium HGW-Wallbacteria-1]|jgi:PAS domain S-box-containing protein|uniref:histidine kinase n=1 Tax=Candidatus Wallbacteria bacterium HGW-Wallbacteria-1 TaxID=2013854 RepID=A0A2N1PP11_9BACT|nr:MAG: hypothetical protein CVV64_11230 [Candidatus Wallbacteria bacterium HGW-Wallbacteria-1]
MDKIHDCEELDVIYGCGLIGVVSLDSSGLITRANRTFAEMTGNQAADLSGRNIFDFLVGQDDLEAEFAGENWPNREIFRREMFFRRNDGSRAYCLVSGKSLKPVTDSAFIMVVDDITQKVDAEALLKASLREKEQLIHEVNHRVKNNLQVVASLIDMASLRLSNGHTPEVLGNIRSKIHTIAMIHEQLYQGESLYDIDMGTHLRALMRYIRSTYDALIRSSTCVVTIDIDREGVKIPISRAIPFSLVLNELVSNAFKHAMASRSDGELKVSMWTDDDGKVFAEVRDNGPGMDLSIDLDKTGNLGLKLVRNIVSLQLKGTFEIVGGEGLCVKVSFRI